MRRGLGFGVARHALISGAADLVAGNPFNTPVLYNISALGTAPVVLAFDWTAPTGDTVYGYRYQYQADNNSDFSSPEQNLVTLLDGAAAAQKMQSTGFNDPSGSFNARVRILRDSDGESGEISVTDQLGNVFTCVASLWSNTYSDAIITSVVVLQSATGSSKTRYANVASPFRQAISNNDVGACCCIRATGAMAAAKGHFEFVIDGLKTGASAGAVNVGICAGPADTNGQDFNSSGFSTRPGSGSSIPGITVRVIAGTATVDISRNGGVAAGVAIPAAPAAGDAVIFEVDNTTPATPVVTIYWYRASTTSSSLIATITMTGAYIPTTIWAFGATERGTGLLTTFNTSDAFTFNAGGLAFLRAPTAGFAF